ncbi:hypothetical protein SDC9_141948 [bioreactor metagenome]|uniref:Uncharacterized protein n=1 Tax=bioreactor metagenome TaxID=1076179 RepID=A0A645DZ54_9ZZZZ
MLFVPEELFPLQNIQVNQQYNKKYDSYKKNCCVVPWGFYFKLEILGIAPETIVIDCFYLKAIFAGCQIAISYLCTVCWCVPVFFQSIKIILVLYTAVMLVGDCRKVKSNVIVLVRKLEPGW